MKKLKLLIAAGLLGLVGAAKAGDYQVGLDFYGQFVRGSDDSSKFSEYRSVPRGVYVDRLCVETKEGDYFFHLEALKPGLSDQRFTVEGGQYGVHKVELLYDQTPHNLSNTAQSLFKNEGGGLYTLPDNVQSTLQAAANLTTVAPAVFFGSPYVPLRVDRTKGGVSYSYNPTGKWRTSLGYNVERREGSKAFGMSLGHGQLVEVLEPVSYQTHNANVQAEYVTEEMGVSLGYDFSLFRNDIKALTVDNPFRVADAALSGAGASAPSTMRAALAPENEGHMGSLGFNYKTSANSRLTTALSYGIQKQDDPFLPLTSNQKILALAGLEKLPDDSLEGEVRTLNAQATWNFRPLDNLVLNIKGRHHDTDNRTKRLTFLRQVPYDGSISPTVPTAFTNPTRTRRSLAVDYLKTNIGGDVTYTIVKPLSVKLAYDHEITKRRFREAGKVKEDTYTASINAGPIAGFTLRPSVLFAERHPKGYHAEQVAHETYPLGEGTALGQIEDLRKTDEAGRRRKRATVRAQWEGIDSLSMGIDYGHTRDDHHSEYGVTDQNSTYASFDVNFHPTERVTFFADYTWEEMVSNSRSRYRATGYDDAAQDWKTKLKDTINTINVGGDFGLVPDKLDFDAAYTMAFAKGLQESLNVNPPQGSGSQVNSALVWDLPATHTRQHRLNTALRYRLAKNVKARLGYAYERYSEVDWSQDSLDVYQSQWNSSVFLGASQPGYNAHMATLGLSYNF